MPAVDPVTAAALTVAADQPCWVEARGLLLSGRGCVVAGDELGSGWVVQGDWDRLSVVVAQPDPQELRRAVHDLPAPWTVLVHADAVEALLGALDTWRMEPATIHAHPQGMLPPRQPAAADVDTPRIDVTDAALMQHVPSLLRSQLEHASAFSPIVGAMAHGRPVAFACAAYETESLWDVSVDTLEEFRSQGYGSAAVHALAVLMRRRFKRPVWGALDANVASIALARRLGFEPVDRLLVFSRPGTDPTRA